MSDLITVKETAEYMRKSEASLRWMIREHTAPPHARIGGRIMFRRSDVDRWIEQQFEGASA